MSAKVDQFLHAPCTFCQYDVERYWQEGTHPKSCPWHTVNGLDTRKKMLPVLFRELWPIMEAALEGKVGNES